ncbi:hypothetical protein HZA44_03905 [Candidatus Peregrinibacteria bacterium]|nr:hypothetical protein [Candidatus Peregrinibacteria bacterium]
MSEAISFSDEAKARVYTAHAEERLKEAEDLVVTSDLNADTRAKIEANFSEHISRVRDLIQKLTASDAKASADIAANLETSLNAHERILTQLSEKTAEGTEKPEIEKLKVKVSEEAKLAGDSREEAEKKVGAQSSADVQAAAEGRIGAAENKIAEVKKYVAGVKATLGADATVQAEAQLTQSDSTLAQAKAKAEAKAYNEAFVLASQSMRMAQEAKLLVKGRIDLKVDLNEDAGDEPEAPTPERAPREKEPAKPTKEEETDSSDSLKTNTNLNVEGSVKVELGNP